MRGASVSVERSARNLFQMLYSAQKPSKGQSWKVQVGEGMSVKQLPPTRERE